MKRTIIAAVMLVAVLALALNPSTAACGTIVDCRHCQGQCETMALDHYSACIATGNSNDFCWDSHEKFKYLCGMNYCPNCNWVKTYYYVP